MTSIFKDSPKKINALPAIVWQCITNLIYSIAHQKYIVLHFSSFQIIPSRLKVWGHGESQLDTKRAMLILDFKFWHGNPVKLPSFFLWKLVENIQSSEVGAVIAVDQKGVFESLRAVRSNRPQPLRTTSGRPNSRPISWKYTPTWNPFEWRENEAEKRWKKKSSWTSIRTWIRTDWVLIHQEAANVTCIPKEPHSSAPRSDRVPDKARRKYWPIPGEKEQWLSEERLGSEAEPAD